jgi:hypothetical protein
MSRKKKNALKFIYDRKTEHYPKGYSQLYIEVNETPPGNHTGTGALVYKTIREFNDGVNKIEKEILLSSSVVTCIKKLIDESMIKTEIDTQFPEIDGSTKTTINININDNWNCSTQYPESLLDCEGKNVDYPGTYKQLFYFLNDMETFFTTLVQCHFGMELLH